MALGIGPLPISTWTWTWTWIWICRGFASALFAIVTVSTPSRDPALTAFVFTVGGSVKLPV